MTEPKFPTVFELHSLLDRTRTVKPGFVVVTAGRDGARCWQKKSRSGPLYAVKVYVATTRQSDGCPTWRLQSIRPGSFSVLKTCVKAAQEHAASVGLPYNYHVSQNFLATMPDAHHDCPAARQLKRLALDPTMPREAMFWFLEHMPRHLRRNTAFALAAIANPSLITTYRQSCKKTPL